MKIKYSSFHSIVFFILLLFTHFSVNSQDFSIAKGLGFDSPNCGEQVLRIELVNHNSQTFVWEKREKVGTADWSAWMDAGEITPPPGYYAKIFSAVNGSQNTYLQFRLRLKNSIPVLYSNVLERYLPGRNAGIITKSVQVACATGVDTVTLTANNYLGDIRWEYQTYAWNGTGYSTSDWFEVPGTAGKSIIKYGLYIYGPANYFYSTGFNFRTRALNELCEAESAPTNFIYGSTQQNSTGSYFTLTGNKPMAIGTDGNYSVSLCEGESIVLTGNHNAGYTSYYKWSNGATTQSINVTEPGVYSFLASWTGPGCERHSSDKRVSVSFNSNPKPTISSSSPIACSDATVTLSSSSGMFYYWSNGQQTQTIVAQSPGTYTVGVYRNNGCYRESDPIVLSSKPLITTPNKTICSGQHTEVEFTSDVVGSTYSWVLQSKSATISGVTAGIIGTSNTISHTLANSSGSTAGNVVYRVTPTANGCTGNYKDVIVTVNANGTGGTVASSQTLCPNGDPAAFTQTASSTGPGSLSYQWQSSTDNTTFNNISAATATTYNVPAGVMQTTYYKRLTSATQNGLSCSASSNTLTVTVNSVSGGTIAGNQTVCSGGDPAAFTQSVASAGPGILTYQWQKSTNGTSYTNINGATATTYNPPSGLTQTTYYKRIVTSSLGCMSESNSLIVTVTDPPIPTISSIGCMCEQYVTLIASSGGTNYVWSTGYVGQTVNMLASGSYFVTVTYPNGCSKQSGNLFITIPSCSPDPCDSSPPESRKGWDIDRPKLEEELIATSTTVYPNPADAKLYVLLPESTEKNLLVKLYSQYGYEVGSTIMVKGENKVEFNTKLLEKGMYTVWLQNSKGQIIFNRRFVIRHP